MTTGSENNLERAARARRKRLRTLRRNPPGYTFISPWLVGLLVFQVYPLVASCYFSFTRYGVLEPPKWVGSQNYVAMVTRDPVFWKSVTNTLYYAGLSVPLGIVSSLGLALLLNMSGEKKQQAASEISVA